MIQVIPISKLESNTGQIKGLPQNPRFIKDERFKALVKSLKDDPEMLELRELLVFPHGPKFVIIGGNMRYRAAIEIGLSELPCKVLSPNTPAEKLRSYTIKDNVSFGQNDFDILANEWDNLELLDFGMEVWDDPSLEVEEEKEESKKSISKKLIVECEDLTRLEELFDELQDRGFNVKL
ncbi:ParB/RepB/Spo0J family partition protein [Flectobacillus sp. DC10W]|uniref:ParB/RepB/Spo0J family partition protein n=1 Tax=Flectobacillus longus TaxID=2984207 RepID=A0ABT6YK78_9BACT|nr:ParB/RepB/Spo0J family partition protein [Flectobacillus longus]MDI9863970.1 ParB/RepB/Spo0J family partition protein [Flectobacillus longus]